MFTMLENVPSLKTLVLMVIVIQGFVVIYQIFTNSLTWIVSPFQDTFDNYSEYSRAMLAVRGDKNRSISQLEEASTTYVSGMETVTGETLKDKMVRPRDPQHVVYENLNPLPKSVGQSIQKWMANAGAECQAATNSSLCPCVPPGLRGKMTLDLNVAMNYTWQDVSLISKVSDLKKGGVWAPSHCEARRRLLLVIPYRDRESHLRAFLAHMHPVLQRQLHSYRIIVVEQRHPILFNKAAMMNIAYHEAEKRDLGTFDCVMFHDVDLIMEDDRNMIICGSKPVHYGVFLDRVNYRQCCGMLFGGAVTFTWQQFSAVNGYSNTFFGWGGEDDNMYYRIQKMNMIKAIPQKDIGTYSTLKHKRDSGNPHNFKNYKFAVNKTVAEGLSTVKYSIVAFKEYDLYTWILADLDVMDLPYPNVETTFYFSNISGECSGGRILQSLTTTTLAQCQEICGSDDNCAVFVSHENGPSSINCVMKNAKCDNVTSNPVKISYIKGVDIQLISGNATYIVYTVDCKGSDIMNIHGHSPSDCVAECNRLEQCKGFAFQASSKKCWLKHTCNPPKLKFGSSNTKSYVKVT